MIKNAGHCKLILKSKVGESGKERAIQQLKKNPVKISILYKFSSENSYLHTINQQDKVTWD